jgi:predicted nucleotidyltransferase/predicted transcriptional regulator
MYEKINFTENTLQILTLFTKNFTSEYYIREVAKLSNISPRTAQLLLEDLETKGIIESKTRGKIKTYKLNHSESTKRYLIFVEQYKSIAFLEKKPLIKEIIEQIIPHIKGIGIVFGSYAKNLETKKSDLDIFVVGTYNSKTIKNISKNFGLEISVKCYPEEIFEKNLKKDVFLKEILMNHIVFLEAERFIQNVFEDK